MNIEEFQLLKAFPYLCSPNIASWEGGKDILFNAPSGNGNIGFMCQCARGSTFLDESPKVVISWNQAPLRYDEEPPDINDERPSVEISNSDGTFTPTKMNMDLYMGSFKTPTQIHLAMLMLNHYRRFWMVDDWYPEHKAILLLMECLLTGGTYPDDFDAEVESALSYYLEGEDEDEDEDDAAEDYEEDYEDLSESRIIPNKTLLTVDDIKKIFG